MALSVIRLENSRDCFELNFELPEKEKWRVVCPNPMVADSTRIKLKNHPRSFETITISKFLGDIYKEMNPDGEVVRKSNLYRILATVWRMKFSNESPSFFEQAFELFTDLRSFTLNPQMIESLLSHYDPVVAEAVRYFWLIVEGQEIIDEHLAYYQILEGLEEGLIDIDSKFKDQGLVFQGFSHLSGSQIDLLKMLGRFCEVYIPLPVEVLNESIKTDWVDWISTQADNVTTVSSSTEQKECAEILEFEKLNQNEALRQVTINGAADVLLVKNSLSFQDILNLKKRDLFFKIDLDLFSAISRRYQLKIDSLLEEKELMTIGLVQWCEEEIENLMGNQKTFQVFTELKFLNILIEELRTWESLSSENESLDSFSLRIIWETLKLNLPRNFNIPLQKENKAKLLTLKGLPEASNSERTIIVVGEGHDLKGGSTSQYSKEVSEILYTLGPVRRKGLDTSLYKAQIKDILSSAENVLMIEKGLMNHDKVWNSLVRKVTEASSKDFLTIENPEPITVSREKDFSIVEHTPADKISASRLQTFLDCPRKYYYSYVLKIGTEPPRYGSVDPRLLGNFEHEVVQQYLEEKKTWESEFFEKTIKEVVKLPEALKDSKILLEETLAEVRFYSKVMIEELLKIFEIDPQCEVEFESPMKGSEAIGFADIYIKSEVFGKILFDLKRSAGSVPTKSNVLNIESIQLWYYMEFLEKERETFDIYGYLNFSDPSSSLLFSNNPDSKEKLEEVKFLKLDKIHETNEIIEEAQVNFRATYDNSVARIKTAKDFPINPKTSGACLFCPGNVICSREVENVE